MSQTSRLGSRFKANCFTVFSASLSFCYDICWPCKLVQNILWTNCKLSKYMFKGKQAKSSLSSNLCVKLISQKSKKVKLYQLPRHRQQTSKHSCGEGRSTQLRITSTLEGNTYFYSREKYLLLLWREILTSTLERNTSCQKGRDLLINTHNCQP